MQDLQSQARQGLSQAENLRQRGKLREADRLATALLADFPDYYAAMHTKGLICADQGLLDQAILYLSKANALLPNQGITLIALSSVFLQSGSPNSAKAFAEQALACEPNAPSVYLMLASIYKDQRDYAKGLEAVDHALGFEPNWPEALLIKTSLLSHIGFHQQALATVDKVLAQDPSHIPALSLKMALPRGIVGTDFARQIYESQVLEKSSKLEPSAMSFLRANNHRLMNEIDTAWTFYLEGNAQIASQTADARNHISTWQNQSLALLKQRPNPTFLDQEDTPKSLFILGASRSGKTTIETSVCTHNRIINGYESPHLKDAIFDTFSAAGSPPTVQLDLMPEDIRGNFRERYLKTLREKATNEEIFTNTSPIQIHNAWALASTLPNAYFVFVTRNLKATATKIFQTNYSSGNQYAYTPERALEHVQWYQDMITECMTRFGYRAVHVSYEDFIENPGPALQKIEAMLALKTKIAVPGAIPQDMAETDPYVDLFVQEL